MGRLLILPWNPEGGGDVREEKMRLCASLALLVAVCALILYRPVLRTVGVDIDHHVPEWAGFFTPGEYDAFLREVNRYFERSAVEIHFSDGFGLTDDGRRLALRLVAQKCHACKRREWAKVVKECFDRTKNENEVGKEADVSDPGLADGRLGPGQG